MIATESDPLKALESLLQDTFNLIHHQLGKEKQNTKVYLRCGIIWPILLIMPVIMQAHL